MGLEVGGLTGVGCLCHSIIFYYMIDFGNSFIIPVNKTATATSLAVFSEILSLEFLNSLCSLSLPLGQLILYTQ